MTDKRQKQQDVNSGQDQNYDPQAEVVGNWKKVDLPQIPVVTGEEEQQILLKMKTKIYRWRAEWKERGVGEMKFLKNKQSQLVRILVRAEKTHKVVINHLLQAKDIFCKLEQLKTSNNSWTWAAYDVSDDKPATQKFCAKFTSKDDFQKFKKEFEKYCTENALILLKLKQTEQKEESKQKEETKQGQAQKKK